MHGIWLWQVLSWFWWSFNKCVVRLLLFYLNMAPSDYLLIRSECFLLASDYLSQSNCLLLDPFFTPTWPTIFFHLIWRFSFLLNLDCNSYIPQSLSPKVKPLSLDWTSLIQTFLLQTFSCIPLIDVYGLSLSNFVYYAFNQFTFSMHWLMFSLHLLPIHKKIFFIFFIFIFYYYFSFKFSPSTFFEFSPFSSHFSL